MQAHAVKTGVFSEITRLLLRRSDLSSRMALSAYELQRQRNIAENEARLDALGLSNIVPAKIKRVKAPKRSREQKEDPDFVPERRATRSRDATEPKYNDDGDDDDDDDDDDEEEEERLSSRKAKRMKSTIVKPEVKEAPAFASDSGDVASCVVIEKAKTGRSKCRRCMEMLNAGELRVGMESWMVGRQVVVWQHPACFLQSVEVAEEATGRGRCKQTKEQFVKGENKLGFSAHTTTSYTKLEAGGECLGRVLLAASRADAPLKEVVKGYEQLSKAEAAALAAGVARGSADKKKGDDGAADGVLEVSKVPTQAEALEQEAEGKQPAKGAVEKAKGKVCWRWCGHLCYGTLMAASETKTHCYARTQKGNTKTLTKGSPSWWVL